MYRILAICILCCTLFVSCGGYKIEQRVFVTHGIDIKDCESITYQVETAIVKKRLNIPNTEVYLIVNRRLTKEDVGAIKETQYVEAERLVECLKAD